MNREILFKAKRKDNGEWVEGYVVAYPSGKAEIHKISKELPDILLICEIDPDTICQYTGQRYKCGKKVSENDIVTISAYSYDEPESDTTGIVVYSEGKACWCLKDLNSDKTIPMYEYYGSYITQISYIGNTFDNPEFVGGGAMSDIKRVCCKDCKFFLYTGNGPRGGAKGKCRIRRLNEVRIGSSTACRMFEEKEVQE